ncbi:hypothetical protein OAB57_02020 [Bacteriovoracaceae bacterium]|nr:hypothetical protein [Bacteriovoracaceae bacterium]
MFKYKIFTLFFLFSWQAAHSQILKEPAIPKCQYDQKVCSYVTQNITADRLIATINPVMFPGIPLDPEEGFIAKQSHKKINFWFDNKELLERFINFIPYFDTLEEFNPSSMIQLTTEIFAITDDALSHFEATFGMSNSGSNGPQAEGTISATFGVGNFVLSAALSAQRTTRQIARITTINQMIPNLSNIQYEHMTKIHISPTAGVSKEEQSGIGIYGNASISRENQEQVLINGFRFFYGLEIPDASGRTIKVNTLKFSHPELYLMEGLSSVLISSNTYTSINENSLGLPLSFRRGQGSTKLMIVIRASSMSFEEFTAQNEKLRKRTLYEQFPKSKVGTFPTDEVPLKTILDRILPFAHTTLSGDRILGIHLDPHFARRKNIKKNIEILITGWRFKQKAVRSLENLMLSGIVFDDLPLHLLQKPIAKLTLRMKLFRKAGIYQAKRTLYLNTATNEFIE